MSLLPQNKIAEKFFLRYSEKPAKQLLYLRIRDHLKYSKAKDVGIDIGCNTMKTKPLFRTNTYVGVDIDADAVEEGLRKFPEATGVVESLDQFNTEKGDYVCCFQMIGVNSGFEETYDSTLDAIHDLVTCTTQGGSLLFNIGGDALESTAEIKKILQEKFGDVSIERISLPNFKISDTLFGINITISIFLSLIVAIGANSGIIPRNLSSTKYCLFICHNKY